MSTEDRSNESILFEVALRRIKTLLEEIPGMERSPLHHIESDDVNDIINYTMLISYLRGNAREAIEGISLTADNYAVAIKTLEDRFSNDDLVEQNLRWQLFNLPYPKHDANQLKDFLTKWNNITGQLETLTGKPTGDPLEGEIILKCLSDETLISLQGRYNTHILGVRQLKEGIARLSQVLCPNRTNDSTSSQSNTVKASPYHNKGSKNERQAHLPNGAFRTNVQATPRKHTLCCCFCQGEHSGKVCTKYATLESRKARIHELLLCFGCLRKDHLSFECTSKSNCFNCNGKHHTFLCVRLMPNPTSVNVNSSQKKSGTRSDPSRVDNNPVVTVQSQPSSSTSQQATAVSNQSNSKNNVNSNRVAVKSVVSLQPTALPTATLQLTNGENQISVRIFLDSGSQRTFINPGVVEKLNLVPIKLEGLTLVPFGDRVETNLFDVVRDKYEDVGLISSTAGAVIFGPIPKWACNVVSDEANVRSVIGTQSIVCSRISAPVNTLDDEDISRLWSLDTIGISEDARSYNDQATIEHFSETIVKVGNKYTVDLPFRNNVRPLTGYRKALGQLYSLRKTLQSKPELFDQYQSVLDEYVKLGFIEEMEVEDDSFPPINGINYYLPHHPVFKESATTPIRIVFNASSKESQQAKSRNDCLHAGPNLAMKLTDMLVEFRQNKYAVVADISKAFLRIGINLSHRYFTRFLWFADRDFKNVKNFRFKVLLFGATCSPFLLNQTIQYHLQIHSDPIARSVMKSFYVDNFMKTYENCDDLELESHKVNQIMLGANIPLGEWTSNLSSFNDRHTPDTVDLNAVKLLGLLWDTSDDSLRVKIPIQIVTYLSNLGNT
ncbi:uncharacterized protein [Palaemon carinicauda]|uniref:uncharacterized protein n=1 Tax=Palaemon carinicauda TaxID=392227 RepID=UPI0035B6A57F